jgi:amino acid adenylation domain-containing protein
VKYGDRKMPTPQFEIPCAELEGSAPINNALSVHALFERAAQQHPENVAVIAGDRHLTFAQLNAQSNQLAHHLRSLGLGHGVCVGVCLDRSVAMLVGLLGVLKAGAAYVPLDPAFPPERLQYMLDNSGAPLVVTTAALLTDLPRHAARVLCVDREHDAIKACPAINLPHDSTPEELAYVIYTSGSTGQPKGVEVTHGGVVNYLLSINGVLGISERDVFMAVTTLSFDICAFDLFSPLAAGGKVLLIDRQTACDGVRLRLSLEQSDATILQATPATWRMLIDSGWRQPASESPLERDTWRTGEAPLKALSGGEALPRELAQNLLARGVDLWNLYGPTETTIYSAYHHVSSGRGIVPIGVPLGNQTLHVLDDQRQPVSIGVAGELYIGGAGVARGYRNRPELTAERFLPDPFSSTKGARIYRTGDIARYRPDGLVEYLGRADHQVKIRGFRIELGEIESNLLKQPGVRAAVVVAQERDNGAQRLVAFVEVDPQQNVAVKALRNGLRGTLPDYMIPAQLVVLPRLPLTLNGKIDRKALPLPQWGDNGAAARVAPTTPIQRDLAAIFARVLRLPDVGVTDSFFDLGGDSLSAVSLSIHIQKRFNRSIALAVLFRTPTVAQLAAVIADEKQESFSTLMVLRSTGDKPPLFCLPGSGGSSLSFRKLVDQLPDDRPVYGYNLPHLDQRPEPLATVRDYAVDVLRQIRQVHPHGPFHLLGYSFGGVVAFEIAHISADRNEALGSLGIIDSWGPGYPYKLPLGPRVLLHLHNTLHGPKGTRLKYLQTRLENVVERFARRWRRLRRAAFYRLPLKPNARWRMEDILDVAEWSLLHYEFRPLSRQVNFYRVNFAPPDWPGNSFEDPHNGWKPLVTGELQIIGLPCDHHAVFEEKGIVALANGVMAQLQTAPDALAVPAEATLTDSQRISPQEAALV